MATRLLAKSTLTQVRPSYLAVLTLALELYSQTKLVTCLAALQLVDRGLVSLDDEADIEKHLPELGKLQLLKGYEEDGKPILEQPTKKSTLRLLMSHQAGGCALGVGLM